MMNTRACATVVAIALCGGALATPAATGDQLAAWFQTGRCPKFNAPYSRPAPNAGKTGNEHLEWIGRISKVIHQSGNAAYLFDPKAGSAFRQIGQDTYGSLTLRVVGPPPPGVPEADLHKIATTSGITLGAGGASVTAKLGQPLVVTGCELQRYVYTIDPEIPNALEFTIRSGHVVEIYQTYGD
jgi:hypothetical protein